MDTAKRMVRRGLRRAGWRSVATAFAALWLASASAAVPNIAPGVWTAIDVKKDGGPLAYGKHLRMIYRTVDKRIYDVGGDYSLAGTPYVQSGRQEFWSYDPKSGNPTMDMIHPYCVGANEAQPERPDESPVAYDSKRDRYYIAAGSWVDNPCGTTTIDKTWGYYDFKDKKWIDTGVKHKRGQTKWATYDAATDRIYMFLWDGGRGLGVQTFEPGTNKQERWWIAYDDHGKYMNGEILADSQLALDEKGRCIYVIAHNSGTLWRYNIDRDSRTTGKAKPNPAFTRMLQDKRLVQKNYSASMSVWDSRSKVLIVMVNHGARGDFTPMVFDPKETQLRDLPKTTSPAGLFPQGNSAIYVPDMDAVLAFCASFTDEPGSVPHQYKAFFFRYGKGDAKASAGGKRFSATSDPEAVWGPVPRLRFASNMSSAEESEVPSRGEFEQLKPKPTKRVLPVFKDPKATQALNAKDELTTRDPFPRYWGYPVYAERGGRGYVYWFGGGHSDYPGNDVEIFDIEHNTWDQSRHPQVPEADDPVYGAGGSPNVFVADTDATDTKPGEWQPYVIHGYGRQSFDYGTDRYVVTATGCAHVSNDAGGFKCTRKRFGLVGFDPDQKTWALMTDAAWPFATQADLTQFDARLGGVVAYYGGRNRDSTDAFLVKDHKLIKLPQVRENISEGGANHGGNASIFIPPSGEHLVAVLPQGGRIPFALWRVDFANGRASRVNVPADSVSLVGKHGNWKMAFDSKRGAVLVMQAGPAGSPRMRWFDPRKSVWSDWFTASNAPRIDPDTAYSGRQLLMYDSVNARFLLLRPNGSWRNGAAELWSLNLTNDSAPRRVN